MATRKDTSLPKTEPQPEKKSSDFVELKLPRLRYGNLLVVGLLLIGAYLIGMQTAKVTYLEDKIETLGSTNQGVSPTPSKVDVEEGNLPILGDKNAKVTIIEFSDFQCPYCKQLFDTTLQQIKKDYIDTGKVKLAYRHYPLPNHPNAPVAALASECANEQDKFWEYHDKLFAEQNTWGPQDATTVKQTLYSYATQLGMNTSQFTSCVETEKYQAKIDEDVAIAQQIGVSATPTSYVNGTPVVGALPYTNFKTILDEQLK